MGSPIKESIIRSGQKEYAVSLLTKDVQRVDGAIQIVETLVLPDGSCVYTPAGEKRSS
jgi:hypothetical protein